ncbi:MAG: serine O-acetyltransferase [Candidatus Omnitrophica bacterium]|nr:serine O-acetyltransferase [Candidatus Omnitrophota bacterium]
MFWIILLFLIVGAVLAVSILFDDEIRSTRERDPAARSTLEILLLYPGLHALIGHRITHFLWKKGVPFLPRAISQVVRFFTGVEIHPGAQIGKSLFIDHGMGVVVGETSIIGNNVTLFQGVTLGGTGKETGKRHPTLGNDVVVGAGAKILGNITIGDNSYVGANAVILRNVPPNSTVVGVPGHITRQDGKKIDLLMDHVHVSDPMMQNMKELLRRIKALEEKAKGVEEPSTFSDPEI